MKSTFSTAIGKIFNLIIKKHCLPMTIELPITISKEVRIKYWTLVEFLHKKKILLKLKTAQFKV